MPPLLVRTKQVKKYTRHLQIVDDFPFCDWCEDTLKYLSLVCVILSILGILITIIYDLCIKFWPKSKLEQPVRVPRTDSEIRNHMSRQLMNVITTWFFSLLVLDCVYLAFNFFDFGKATADTLDGALLNSCITIGALLHFSLLCSFCLSLSISFLQYYLYFKSFRMLKFIYAKAICFSLGKLKQNLTLLQSFYEKTHSCNFFVDV